MRNRTFLPEDSDVSGWKHRLVYVFLFAWMINILFHVPSFYRENFKGDKYVYLYLSKAMHWDQSNYSTAKHSSLSKWPNSIYRQPLFHHGPLVPYILKLGALFGKPVQLLFVFVNSMMAVFFIHLLVLYRRLKIPFWQQAVGSLAVAFAPLLIFSTTRIHMDALAGILIACGLVAYVEALENTSSRLRCIAWSIWSGILFSLALNARFSAIICLPIILFTQLFYIMRVRGADAGSGLTKENAPSLSTWRVFAIVAFIVATLGLQHFYRIYATYGSIFPWDFMTDDFSSQWHQYLQTRTRSKNLVNLILLVPFLLLLPLPKTWAAVRDGIRTRGWGVVFLLFSLYLMVMLFLFSYRELRFFAMATPVFYCCLPWILHRYKPGMTLLAFISISLGAMAAVAYREAVVRPDEAFMIVPVFYDFIPPLRQYW